MAVHELCSSHLSQKLRCSTSAQYGARPCSLHHAKHAQRENILMVFRGCRGSACHTDRAAAGPGCGGAGSWSSASHRSNASHICPQVRLCPLRLFPHVSSTGLAASTIACFPNLWLGRFICIKTAGHAACIVVTRHVWHTALAMQTTEWMALSMY